MPLKFNALPTDKIRSLQTGGPDANGLVPERTISNGHGNPCRHCLREIPYDKEMLIVAYRPFPTIHPYAEVGPIFLCAEQCERHPDSMTLPDMFQGWAKILVRGYSSDDRIRYGTGKVIDMNDLERVAEKIFEDSRVEYIHMRSASNNCYQCRIERV